MRRSAAARGSQRVPPGAASPPQLPPGAGPPPAPERACVGARWCGQHLHVRWRAGAEVTEERVPAEHACCLRASDLDLRVSGGGSLGELLRGSRYVTDVREEPGEPGKEPWARVAFRDRAALKAMCEPRDVTKPDNGGFLSQLGVQTYEADLHPVRRWMLEHRVPVGRPRRVYLDVEAHHRGGILEFDRALTLCWVLVDERDEDVARGVLAGDSADAEAQLLAELVVALQPFDQVLAWNGDRYDFELLRVRAELLGLKVDWRRWLLLDHLVVFRRANVSASKSGDEKTSYALGAVARVVLGEAKAMDLSEERHLAWKAWSAGGEERERLVAYCRDDAGKMARIERETGYVGLHQSICEVAGVLPETRSVGPKTYVEGFLMRLGRERGARFPTFFGHAGEEGDDDKHFDGAYVLKPTRFGVHRDVHVIDYARLYPSISQTFNVSPETLVKRASDVAWVEGGPAAPPEGVCVAPGTGHWFRREPRGLLPSFFDEGLRLRKVWDDKKSALPPGSPEWVEADRRSTAYKNMVNAGFGVTGSVWSRFFVVECAESMTVGGAHLIKLVIADAERRGMRALFGDTDSGALVGASRSEVEGFVAWVNEVLLPDVARSGFSARCQLKLAYEKQFSTIVIVAGKRYAGRYSHFKGTAAGEDSEPEIKGLEYKRGDCPRLAREMQAEALDLLLGGGVLPDPSRGLDRKGRARKTALRDRCEDDPEVFRRLVERWRDRVLRGPLDVADVAESKRLSREVEGYAKRTTKSGKEVAQPPHVRVARELRGRGRDVGSGVRVAYVVEDKPSGRVIPAEDFTGENVDRHQLWEDRVYPPTMRVLEACFPAVKWSLWRATRKHAGLPGQKVLFEL